MISTIGNKEPSGDFRKFLQGRLDKLTHIDKIENGFEWIDKPPIKARLNLIKMELRYGYERNGWIDTSAAQRCVRPSVLKK